MHWVFPHVFYDVAGGTGDFDVLPTRLIVATVIIVGAACAGEHAVYLCVTLSFLKQDAAVEIPCVLIGWGCMGRPVCWCVLPIEIAPFEFCAPPMVSAACFTYPQNPSFHSLAPLFFYKILQ